MKMRCLMPALLACALVPLPALAGARQQATILMSENANGRAAQEEWGFADAVITGDTVYLSGVVAGLPPGDTDLKAAYARAMAHLDKILARAGVGWDDVVDMTTFHTDLPAQLDAFVAVKKNYIKAPFPAWTAIGVTRLVPDAGITEIKLTAKLPKAK